MRNAQTRIIWAIGAGFIAAAVVGLLFLVPAESHAPDDITITGVASPGHSEGDCRAPDEAWVVDWTLFVDEDAGPFDIIDTEPVNVPWDGTQVQAGSSASAGVNYNASVESAQITVEHSNNVPGHETIFYHSEVVERPPLCEPETPEPTATPEPTSTPEPEPTATPDPVVFETCIGDSRVVYEDGVITSVVNPHADCITPTIPPLPTNTPAPSGIIVPPSTGSGGMR